jgi:arabinogalactan endo-1,4-beta-galactosidase
VGDAGVKMPEVLIHIDDGWNITLKQRWFGALVANDVKTADWTTFGVSFYPFYGTSATFTNLKNSLHTLADQYRKPLQVVETDYPGNLQRAIQSHPNILRTRDSVQYSRADNLGG